MSQEPCFHNCGNNKDKNDDNNEYLKENSVNFWARCLKVCVEEDPVKTRIN